MLFDLASRVVDDEARAVLTAIGRDLEAFGNSLDTNTEDLEY